MMQRKTYVIDGENGVGVYLSKILANRALEDLHSYDGRIVIYDDYESARRYVFSKYESDEEINLNFFRPNYSIKRDRSQRYNFYIRAKHVIAYGINEGQRYVLQCRLKVSDRDVVETETTRMAEEGARRGFVELYGDSRFYYNGHFCPGEFITFDDLLRYNGFKIV